MAERRASPIGSGLRGQTVSHYKIEEQIGEGGMGVVYRALDTVLERHVAIKFLPEHCAKDANRRARFEREAKLLATLEHRNIGRIYGLETAGENCFLVLELIPGANLGREVPRHCRI
jgi:serine/threonine protein kinase